MSEQGRTSTGALGKRLWRDWVWKRPGLFLLGTLFAAITAGAAASYAGVIAWTFDMLDQRDPGIFPAAPLAIIALATLRSLSLYAQTVQTNKDRKSVV